MSKGEEVGKVKELIFTKKQWPNAGFGITGLDVPASGHL